MMSIVEVMLLMLLHLSVVDLAHEEQLGRVGGGGGVSGWRVGWVEERKR